MKVLYAVRWMDIEYGWGAKPDGFKIYDDLQQCIYDTKEKSESGNYEDGYFGPERPLGYYETADEIQGPFPCWVNDIKFKSNLTLIK